MQHTELSIKPYKKGDYYIHADIIFPEECINQLISIHAIYCHVTDPTIKLHIHGRREMDTSLRNELEIYPMMLNKIGFTNIVQKPFSIYNIKGYFYLDDISKEECFNEITCKIVWMPTENIESYFFIQHYSNTVVLFTLKKIHICASFPIEKDKIKIWGLVSRMENTFDDLSLIYYQHNPYYITIDCSLLKNMINQNDIRDLRYITYINEKVFYYIK